MTSRGTLFGVGLGPGDPELVTVKAARVIGEAGCAEPSRTMDQMIYNLGV